MKKKKKNPADEACRGKKGNRKKHRFGVLF